MSTQILANTVSTNSELLQDEKKKAWKRQVEKMCRLLTVDLLSTLPNLPDHIWHDDMACLWHDDQKASCRHWVGVEGYPLWHCWGCARTYNPLNVVALSMNTSLDGNWHAVWARAVELVGGIGAVDGVAITDADLRPSRSRAPEGPPNYPPNVAATLASPRPISAEPEAVGWLQHRGLDPAFVEQFGLAYSAPTGWVTPPWTRAGRGHWHGDGYRLIVPVINPSGRRVSVRARQTGANLRGELGASKVRVPCGFSPDETLMVNHSAWRLFVPRLDDESRALLAWLLPGWSTDEAPLPTEIEVAEGEVDYLLRCELARPGVAVLGIHADSWCQAFADRIPDGAVVRIYCHSDRAGQSYQHRIARSLRGRGITILVRNQRVRLVDRRVGVELKKQYKDLDEAELAQKLGRDVYVTHSDTTENLHPYLPPEPSATVAGRAVVVRVEPRTMSEAAAVEAAPVEAAAIDTVSETLPEVALVETKAVAAPASPEVTETPPEAVLPVVAPAAPAQPVVAVPAPVVATPVPTKKTGRPSVVDQFVEIVVARRVQIVANDRHELFAEVPTDGGRVTQVPLTAKTFGPLIVAWGRAAGLTAPSKPTLERVVQSLAADAKAQLITAAPPAEPHDGEILGFHDADNAVRLERFVRGRSIHAPLSGWLTLRDGVWERDPKAVVRLAEAAMRKISDEAGLTIDEDLQKQIKIWHQRSLSKQAIEAAISLASSRESLSIAEDDLDKDEFFLGVANGVLDLRTRELVADPTKALVTRRCPVAWNPHAKCPRWLWFLDQMFDGDQGKVDFLQRYFGYIITGDVRYHLMLFLYGVKARNGKTTILDIILALLGDYAHKGGHAIISASRARGTHTTDRDQMRGRRATVIDEWPRNVGFDEEQFKTVTGSRRQTSRDIGKSESNYRATTKLIGASNGGMTISSADNAIWARVVMLECPISFLGRENRELWDELIAELDGILVWAADGTAAWLRPVVDPETGKMRPAGLQVPAHVRAFTDAAREKLDHLGRWAEECLEFETGAKASPTALSNSWATWCEQNKIPAEAGSRLSLDSAGDVFQQRWGLPEKRGNGGMRVIGVRVRGVVDMPGRRGGGLPTADDLDSVLSGSGIRLVRP